ncbi:MarR family winged helix-turn-helix transcriptional regulator [Collimonas sp. NPDC087041]|uniref:MarR family winged helix-turn-helix transcriptional regulator n=1 Tax=Collimonas sp. NPDC087041 TaxID=3363960 RepID=UPI00382CB8F2
MKNNLSDNPMRLIGHTYRTFARLVDGPLGVLGLAVGQLPVLVSLKKNGQLSQAALARLAQVEQPSMAQLLNRMERDGLVQRAPDPDDRRSHLISLTADASQRLPKGKAVMEAVSRQALSGFSKEEQDQLMALILRVNANLDRAIGEMES